MTPLRADGPPSQPSSQVTLLAFQGEMAPLVYDRLVKALGPKRAAEIMRATLASRDDRPLNTVQDLLDFAELMISAGGLVQAVGRSLKVLALLRGAVEKR